jgi:PAS domain S-box-containing protein
MHPAENGPQRAADSTPGQARVLDLLARGAPPIVVHEALCRLEEQLREREAQYRAIFEATTDGLIINDPETGVVVEANPAACRMHGYSYDEFLGLHPTAFIHPDDHATFAEYLATVRAGGEFRVRARDVRKDGTPFYVDVRGSAFSYLGKPHVLGLIRDVTEQEEARRTLEQRVAERTRELRALLDISHNLASTLDLRPLLAVILDQLKAVVDFSSASILAQEGPYLTVLSYRRDSDQTFNVLGMRFSIERMGPIWEAILQREPVVIADINGDGELAGALRHTLADVLPLPPFNLIRSFMVVPLALKDRVLGVVTTSQNEPQYFTRRHASLVLAIANQAAVAIENARLYQQAQELAALEERQRLARDLHDSVSQALYGIALGARTARTLLDRDPGRVAEPLDYVLSLAEAGLAEMRALIFELRPESLQTEGLVAALGKLVAAMRARHNIAIEATLCDEPDVPLELKEPIYRIAQESLHNTVKHARARHVTLRLQCGPDGIVLEIEDDGVGFDPAGDFPGHLGLRSMRERAAARGGTLDITSAPDQGTHLRAWLPSPPSS